MSNLLKDCVEQAALSGEVISAKILQRRFGGDVVRIEDQLAALAKSGRVASRQKRNRKGLPFQVYYLNGVSH